MVGTTMDTLASTNMKAESSYSKPKRKRIHIPHSQRPTEFVAQRNERERSRVHSVNEAFMVLKKHVPLKVKDPSKRVSKAKILLAALDHIHNLLDCLENGKSQESCITTHSSLQNHQPGKKSRTQIKKRQVKKHTASNTITNTKTAESYFECIPEVKENQFHKSTDRLLYNDNSQFHSQMQLAQYEQYSPNMYNQYRSEFQTTQQQFTTSPNSAYGQYEASSQFDNERHFSQMEPAVQEYMGHSSLSESWMPANTAVPEQNATEYYPNTVQTIFRNPESRTPYQYQMTESWLHDLPLSPNDSGFGDDKSTSGVSDMSFPLTDDDLSENTLNNLIPHPETKY
ncbi:unnamed protein product [Owenia fusiformis]|uniref:Uncharacterized protein n=1 Tax=Owenia fusiformis TaxID=6347 RepID=A0A8J1TB83_OWEFU|nr:unnamed protein product [Owenia fusiformis]